MVIRRRRSLRTMRLSQADLDGVVERVCEGELVSILRSPVSSEVEGHRHSDLLPLPPAVVYP